MQTRQRLSIVLRFGKKDNDSVLNINQQTVTALYFQSFARLLWNGNLVAITHFNRWDYHRDLLA